MLILVRHGSTPFLDGAKKIEGWSKIPLDTEGKKQAKFTAEHFKGFKPDTFDSSDLLRATETADELVKTLNMKYKPVAELRTWNPGIFEGRPVDTNIKKLNAYIDNPLEEVPGSGGSYTDFYHKVAPYIHNKVSDDKLHLAVSHNRVITLARALASNKGKNPNFSILKSKGVVEPAGIMIIHPDWTIEVKNFESKDYANAS